MNTNPLQTLIRRFLEAEPKDPAIRRHLEEHSRRQEAAARLLHLDRIPSLTRAEITAFLKDTDAYFGVRGRQQLWRRMFGDHDERLPALRDALVDLVRHGEAGLNASGWNTLNDAMPGIGPAYLSEILALRFPDKYWLWNKQVQDFLTSQEVDVKEELPWGKKGDPGEQYMATGRHLQDLRRALAEAAGRPVDQMFTDLFLFWANRQGQPEQWSERIAHWLQELFPPERLEARLQGESRARARLEEKAGRFSEADLRQFFSDLNSDWWNGREGHQRWSPALYGPQVNRMAEALDAFNRWAARIWSASDSELDELLDRFWELLEVPGAGTTLPTALLYLREPQAYNVWLEMMSDALSNVAGFEPGRWRTAEGYRRFNAAANGFRDQYHLSPQALDVILWKVWKESGSEQAVEEDTLFRGFTQDTFLFLQELSQNNSEEWMHKDANANEDRRQAALAEPLRLLFEAVAPKVAEMNPDLETTVKVGRVMASMRKRFPDAEGPYHTYLWGAFYRKGRTKQTDAQLFVIVHPDHVNVGFSVAGARGSGVLEAFRHNLQLKPDLFLHILQGLPTEFHVATAEKHGLAEKQIVKVDKPADLEQLSEAELIDVERRFLADDKILFQPAFADDVTQLFAALRTLYRYATANDQQLAELEAEIMKEEEEVAPEEEPRYSLEDLAKDTYLDLDFWPHVEHLMHDKRQIVLYGPPGTGKTWIAQRFARHWVEAAPDPGGEVQVVQFHPSYAYEEFVEGIRPLSVEGKDGRRDLDYPVKKGIFWLLCNEARSHAQRRYVMILDEINRGELPRILGELLFLLEYRTESVVLPYSGDRFNIPKNVFLIGTMNTADRSIALVDHALRRRFHFLPLRPNADVLRAYLEEKGKPEMAWVADLLDLVNDRLQKDGVEWYLHIGHSHFMREDLDDTKLDLIWKHSILPTLEEYFYRQADRLRAYQLPALRDELGEPDGRPD